MDETNYGNGQLSPDATHIMNRKREQAPRLVSQNPQQPQRPQQAQQGQAPQHRSAPQPVGQRGAQRMQTQAQHAAQARRVQPQGQRTQQAHMRRQASGQAQAGYYQLQGARQVRGAQRRSPARRGGFSATPILAGAAALALLFAIVFIFIYPLRYDINLNGERQRVGRGDTIQTLIDQGIVSPKAGNLLAIDGSVLTEGAGEPFVAVVNGNSTSDPTAALEKDATITISDGGDLTEKTTSTEKTIPHGTASSNTDISGYWTGSLHVYSEGQDGVETTITGAISGKTKVEMTTPVVDAGYNIYTADPGEEKLIALTFDDGPWPETTDAILDILEENNAKATFFTIGNQISSYSAQVKRAHEMGNLVLTHSYDHAAGSGQGVNMTYMSAQEQIEELTQGYAAIKSVTGEEPLHIFRAPGGNFYGDIIENLKSTVDAEIGWDVDTEDWRLPGSDAIYEAIMSAQPGHVVLMHDGGGDRAQTVEAVRRAVPELIKNGFKLVTVDELLKYAPSSTSGESSTADASAASGGMGAADTSSDESYDENYGSEGDYE